MDSSAGSSSQVAPTPGRFLPLLARNIFLDFEDYTEPPDRAMSSTLRTRPNACPLHLALPLPRRNQQLGRPRQRRETTVVRRRHDRRAEGEPRRGLGMDRDVLAAGYAG